MKTLTNTMGLGKQASKLIVFAAIVAVLMAAFVPFTTSAVYGSTEVASGDSVHEIEHTVTFYDIDGTVLSVQTVKDGESAVPPTITKKKGYKFIGWDNWYINITDDTKVNAVYELVMTTEDEDEGELGAAGTANPPAPEKIAVATEGGLEVIDLTTEEAVTTPEIIKNNPTPTTVIDEPETTGLSPTTIVLIVIAALVVLAIAGYFIFAFMRKRRSEEYSS